MKKSPFNVPLLCVAVLVAALAPRLASLVCTDTIYILGSTTIVCTECVDTADGTTTITCA